jgi:spermidine synthase
MVVKFDLNNLERAGRTVGRIYAFSARGSIIGTFVTGYFLISFLGTKLIVIGVSVIFVLISFFVLISEKSLKSFLKEKTNIIFGGLLIFSFFISGNCAEETNYYCINARAQTLKEGVDGYVLRLDHLVHSFVYPGNEEILTYDYEKFYKVLTEYRIKETGENNFSAFFLGGGGYTLPRYFEKIYSESAIEVAEIDPGVTKFNYEHLSLNQETKIVTVNEDARLFLDRAPSEKKYDLIFGDAFNDFAVPYHLTTLEFGKIVKEHLSPNGYYAVNVIDNYKYGKFVSSFVKTMKEIFPYVYLAPLSSDWKQDKRNTFVILAGETEIDMNKWGEILWTTPTADIEDSDDSTEEIGYFVAQEEADSFLKDKKAIVLTDDYVPIDNFLAPVFNSIN